MALAYASQQLILDHRLPHTHSRAYATASVLQLVRFPDPRPVAGGTFQARLMVMSMKSQSRTKAPEMDFWMAVYHRTQRRHHHLPPHCCLRFRHLHLHFLRRPCRLHSPKDHRFLLLTRRMFYWGCYRPGIPTLLFPVRRSPRSRATWLSPLLDRAQQRRRLWLHHVSDDAVEPPPSLLLLSQGYLEAPARSRGR